jgi:hypothetical protein
MNPYGVQRTAKTEIFTAIRETIPGHLKSTRKKQKNIIIQLVEKFGRVITPTSLDNYFS